MNLSEIIDSRFDYHSKATLKDEIHLTDIEKRIFDYLLRINSLAETKTIFRVAGGWVRDKLSGKDAHDIDIVLDNMTGKDLYRVICSKKELSDHFHLIKTETEHSGHLQTIKAKIYDEEIDFVHLRREAYSVDSRIPVSTELAGPHDDCKRRDLTINSLFYNINDNRIEDFSECGRTDLEHGVIRTPSSALESFLEDPLRLLRSIRFACNFNFIMEDSMFEAGTNHDVHKQLIQKVSRERIGVEIEKILLGNDPVGGFALIHEMGIVPIVFAIPLNCDGKQILKHLDISDKEWKNSMFRMRSMFHRGYKTPSVLFASFLSRSLERNLEVFKDKKHKYGLDQIKGYCDKVMIDSLRFHGKYPVECSQILYYAMQVVELLKFDILDGTIGGKECDDLDQKIVMLGHWIRGIKENWIIAAHLASLWHTTSFELVEERELQPGDRFCASITKSGFDAVIHMKPLLNGNEVSAALNLGRKGNLIGHVLNRLIEWQILNYQKPPTKDDALVWIKKQSSDDLFPV